METLFVSLWQGLDPGHPLAVMFAFLVFIAWTRRLWPFNKLNGNGNGIAVTRANVSALEKRMESHERQCDERHARVDSRLESIENDVSDIAKALARIEGYISAKSD